MKYQICKILRSNFKIRKFEIHRGHWIDLDIPEKVYEEIKKKLHGKPYTGIHGEIMNLRRGQIISSDVLFDFLYNNGFEYLFEE